MRDLFSIPLLVAGAVFGIMTLVQWIALRRFQSHGTRTKADVTGVSVRQVRVGKELMNVHQLELAYTVEGETYSACLAVPCEKTKDAVGTTVNILYDPKEPKKCIAEDKRGSNKNLLATLLLTVFFLCMGLALLSMG